MDTLVFHQGLPKLKCLSISDAYYSILFFLSFFRGEFSHSTQKEKLKEKKDNKKNGNESMEKGASTCAGIYIAREMRYISYENETN